MTRGCEEAVSALKDIAARNTSKEQELSDRTVNAVESRAKIEDGEEQVTEQLTIREETQPNLMGKRARAKRAEADAAEQLAFAAREAVQRGKLTVDEAELKVMQLRAERNQRKQEFEHAQQRLLQAHATLRQQVIDADDADKTAQQKRTEAQAAHTKETKEIVEAKEAQELAQRERSETDEAKAKHERLTARQELLAEGDKASLRVDLSVDARKGTRASLEPGDVGTVVMVSDDKTRVRVQGPTVRGRSGHCSWYAQSELERPAAAGMLNPQLPSALDSGYLAHMKTVDNDPPIADYYDNLGAVSVAAVNQDTDNRVRGRPGAIVSSPKEGMEFALPPGWEQHSTPDGMTYYIDHNRQQRHRQLSDSVLTQIQEDEKAQALRDRAATTAIDSAANVPDVGKALNSFFTDGVSLAVVNPSQLDIRRQTERHASRAGLDMELGLGTRSAVNAAALLEKLKWTDYLQAQDALRSQKRRVEEFRRLGNASITDVIKAQDARKDAHRRQRRIDDRAQRSIAMKATTAAHEYAARERTLHKQHAELAAKNTHTAVHEAASTGDIERLGQLISDNPSALNAGGEYGQTPLILAAAASRSAALQLLIDMGAVVDSRDDDGMTALMWACAAKAVDCVEVLLQASALVTLTDANGNTATDWAASPAVAGGSVLEKRNKTRTISKRRWGKALVSADVQSGTNWKTGYAAHTGEGWSLTTHCAPVKPRGGIHPSSGMLRETDFSIYRKAQLDFKRYPGTGYPVTSTTESRSSLLGAHLLVPRAGVVAALSMN